MLEADERKGIKPGQYLVNDDEEHAIGQNRPDEDVPEDSRHQIVRVGHHDRPVPVNSNKRPGQRTRRNWGVDEARRSVVAEVQRREIHKVEDEHDLGPGKVRANKEHDKSKVEQVVEDKVAANAGSPVNRLLSTGEEVRDVAKLENEENDPVHYHVSTCMALRSKVSEQEGGHDKPVDIAQNGAHGESRPVQVILVPDAAANGEAILGLVDNIVD